MDGIEDIEEEGEVDDDVVADGDVDGDTFDLGDVDVDLKRLERRKKLPLPNMSPAFGWRAQ